MRFLQLINIGSQYQYGNDDHAEFLCVVSRYECHLFFSFFIWNTFWSLLWNTPNLGLEVPICNNIYTHDSKKYFILYREFAPTSGSGISEPKPTDRAKVEHQSINLTIYLYYQNISQWFSYLFRYCRILAAGCKLLPLETRKCLHCNQPMCWLLCVRQS